MCNYVPDEKEEKLNLVDSIMSEMPSGMGAFEIDENEVVRYLFLNDGFYKMIGADRNKFKKIYNTDDLRENIYGSELPGMMAEYREALRQDRVFNYNYRVRMSEDEEDFRWINLKGRVKRNDAGKVIFYAAFSDINLVKKALQSMSESRASLAAAIEHSNMISWEHDFANECIVWGDKAQRVLYVPAVLHGVPESFLTMDILLPEYHEKFTEMLRKIRSGVRTVEDEMQFRSPEDGEIRWQRVIYTITERRNGIVRKAVATATDITDEKRAVNKYLEMTAYREVIKKKSLFSLRVDLTANKIFYDTIESSVAENYKEFRDVDDFFESVQSSIPQNRCNTRAFNFFSRDNFTYKFHSGKSNTETDYRIKDKEGKYIWLRCYADMLTNPLTHNTECIMSFSNITEEKNLDIARKIIIEDNLEISYYVNINTGIRHIVKASAGLEDSILSEPCRYELRLGEFIENSIFDDDKKLIKTEITVSNIVKKLETHDIWSVNYRVYGKNGKLCWKRVQMEYLDDTQQIILFSRTDVTDIVQKEAEYQEELLDALEKAREASIAKGSFLSNMSHEMRTPLNGIKGILDIFEEKELCTDRKLLKDAIVSVKHLGGLINDILDMSKIESGKFELSQEVISLKEFADYIMVIMGPLAREKNQNLILDMQKQIYDKVLADGKRLKQITINILSNAVKYTGENGKIIFRLRSEIRNGKLDLIISCIDNGIGMSEDFLRTAFDPFTREKENHKIGTGLGLAITKNLVELMDGSINIKSEVGKGTDLTFRITVPFIIDDSAGISRKDEIDWKSIRFDNRRILMVEDNEINRNIADIQLKTLGFEVEEAENGKIALDKFRASAPGYYDAILMDIMMPVMDGLTASREIRALGYEYAESVPIIAMTANAFADDVHKSLENGMNYHISKPFDKIDLVKTLWSAFKEDKQEKKDDSI